MAWLVDTNFLLRGIVGNENNYELARKASRHLLRNNQALAYTLQNLTELWNVCTRPVANNGFALSVAETEKHIQAIEHFGSFLPDNNDVKAHWRRLVIDYDVKGMQVHDARLVASMLAHGITHILTFNDKDFRRYAEIKAVHPDEIIESSVS